MYGDDRSQKGAKNPVLLISVWPDDATETDSVGSTALSFRVRILSCPRLLGGGSPRYSTTVEETIDQVRQWLELVVGSPPAEN